MKPTPDTAFSHYLAVVYAGWCQHAKERGHWRDAARFADISLDYWRKVQWV